MTTSGSIGEHDLLAFEPTTDAATDSPVAAATAPPDLRTLFHTHYGLIWRLLRRLGVPASQLDDAAQEVFWVAARRLPDIRAGHERAFLYGVAMRVASNLLRRQRSNPPMSELDVFTDLADGGPSPEQETERRRRRRLLDAALARLPHELRTVFVLFELEGLMVKEIADLEDIPVGTASSRLRRAREEFATIARRLRATLRARGEDS